MNHQRLRQLTLSAVCIAFGVVLPFLFHSIPRGGMIFCPMHLPVLLCGLLAGPWYGLACGLFTPLLSSMITGMPPVGPYLYGMIIELAVYGMVAGLMFSLVKTKKPVVDIYVSLITAMIAGRVVYGLVKALFFTGGKPYGIAIWLSSTVVSCLPGIIMHLVFVPLLYAVLVKAKLAPDRARLMKL